MIQPLTWAGFAFMAAAVAAAPFVKVDFHNVGAIVAASVSALTALAGLCLHPPWSVPATPPVPAPVRLPPVGSDA